MFKLQFKTDTAPFGNASKETAEIARILGDVSERIKRQGALDALLYDSALHDVNGVEIGKFDISNALPSDAPELSIEVSAVTQCSDGAMETCNQAPEQSDGYGVYIRAPLAFHIRDFMIDEPYSRDEARAQAFAYGDALAEHLGCAVVSQISRDAPAVPADAPAISQSDLLDSAACLWEVALDLLNRLDVAMTETHELAQWQRDFIEERADFGTAHIRVMIVELAEACHRDWEAARNADAFDAPFDWEFCPAWLEIALERKYTGMHPPLPIWREFCAPAWEAGQ